MDAANPYAPPTAPLADGAAPADPDDDLPAWRLEGRALIARNGATLPDICLYTGEATTPSQRIRLPLSWTPGWFKIMAVFAPMLAVFTYGFFRRTSSLEVGLGQAGRKQRRLGALLVLGAAACGVGLAFVLTGRAESAETAAPLLVVGLIVLTAVALAVRLFRVVHIDRKLTRLMLRPRVADAFARLPPPGAPPPV